MEHIVNKIDGKDIISSRDINIRFDETGPQQSTIALLASSKAGKSTMIERIYTKYYKGQKRGYITTLFSTNAHVPIYDSFEIKASRVNNMTLMIPEMEHRINEKTKNHYKFLNVFDDCLNVRQKKLIEDMVLTYRNANMSTIISLQHTMLLSPAMRSNFNHIICGWFNNDENIQHVIKFWFSSLFAKLGCKNMDSKIAFYKKLTANHSFIYYCTLTGDYEFVHLAPPKASPEVIEDAIGDAPSVS